jgi:hypothetical protein
VSPDKGMGGPVLRDMGVMGCRKKEELGTLRQLM